MNPHVQAVQNTYGKGGYRALKAELRSAEVDPRFKKNRQHCGVIKNVSPKIFKLELVHLNQLLPIDSGKK